MSEVKFPAMQASLPAALNQHDQIRLGMAAVA